MLDDEILAGIPGDDIPISRHTRRVAELLRLPGAADHWRERCRESFKDRRRRHEIHSDWQRRRREFAAEHYWFAAARCWMPPQPGWAFGGEVLFSWDGATNWHAPTWFPPALAFEVEPFHGPLLQFSPRHVLSLADCYFVLAVVHDAERQGPGKLNPFAEDDFIALLCYNDEICHVRHLSESGMLTLDDCLHRVDAELTSARVAVFGDTQPSTVREDAYGDRGTRSATLSPRPPDEADGKPMTGEERNRAFQSLQPAVQKAYLAFQYAESTRGTRLEDREAYDLITEDGIPSNRGSAGSLTDYELPEFDTWARQLRTARNALREQKYIRRGAARPTRSVVKGSSLENQRDDA